MRRPRLGITLTETVLLIVLAGVAASITVPRLLVTPEQQTQTAARALADELERLRDEGVERGAAVEVAFDPVGGAWDAWLDADGDGRMRRIAAEQAAITAPASGTLEVPVRFSRGTRPAVPGFPEAEAVSFDGAALRFDARGRLAPAGQRGVLYLGAAGAPEAMAAVTVAGHGQVRVWTWHDGAWH